VKKLNNNIYSTGVCYLHAILVMAKAVASKLPQGLAYYLQN
jgi:hypothetical protein